MQIHTFALSRAADPKIRVALIKFSPVGRQAAHQVRLEPFPPNHKATLDLCQVKIVSEERERAEAATPVYEILQDNRKTFPFYPVEHCLRNQAVIKGRGKKDRPQSARTATSG